MTPGYRDYVYLQVLCSTGDCSLGESSLHHHGTEATAPPPPPPPLSQN